MWIFGNWQLFSDSTFYIYKNENSIVLLGLVGAHYIFNMINVGAYGQHTDGNIYQESLMRKIGDSSQLNVQRINFTLHYFGRCNTSIQNVFISTV